jgi:hypothetical protein
MGRSDPAQRVAAVSNSRSIRSWPVSHLYDEPISAETRAGGVPAAITWRGSRMHVRQVMSVWQMPGDARLYRVGVTTADGRSGMAEIVAAPGAWRLRRYWA